MFHFSISEETSSADGSAGTRVSSTRVSRLKRLVLPVACAVLLAGAAKCGLAATDAVSDKARLAERYGKLPLSFEANRGQAEGRVKFLARGDGYSMALTSTGAVLKLRGQAGGDGGPAVLGMELLGAAQDAVVYGTEQLPGVVNYFIGNDPAKWQANIATYGKVRYRGVYPGVDAVFYGNQRRLEYDFVVAPGSDPGRIALGLTGVAPSLNADGDVVLKMAGGDLLLCKPVVYQGSGDGRKSVEASYAVSGGTVRFKLGEYDHSRELVIDPKFDYVSYLGGSGIDEVGTQGLANVYGNTNFSNGLAVDSAGNSYVTGQTYSSDFPTKSGYEDVWTGYTGRNQTAFVSKINPTGTALVYSTYLGGSNTEGATAIAVDAAGDAFVTGQTQSTDYPTTTGAYITTLPGFACCSAFVTKLNPAGNALVYSSFLGAQGGNAAGFGIAVDGAGQAYVVGNVSPQNNGRTIFPTTSNALQTTTNVFAGSGFVTVFNAAGSSVLYSTLVGDSNAAQYQAVAQGVAVDANGNFYIAGSTTSPNLPVTAGAFQTTANFEAGVANPPNAFAAKFGPVTGTGNLLTYLTYLRATGADWEESGAAIAADANGNAYVAGTTGSATFPTTTGAYQAGCQAFNPPDNTECHNSAGFVTKINPTGTALVWSTLLGLPPTANGGQVNFICCLALDPLGNVYVGGQAQSGTPGNGFPLVYPVQTGLDNDALGFVSKFDPTGSTLLFSSLFGDPTTNNYISGMAVDSLGDVYVGGLVQGTGTGLPVTSGAFQPANGGGEYDGWVARVHIDLAITSSHAGNFIQGETGASYVLTVSNIGNSPISGTVTVTETVPTGLTLTAMSGSGWTCTTLPTCTRADALAAGASYPPITVTVNVASNAAATVTNAATVTGGTAGSTGTYPASDATTITSPAGSGTISSSTALTLSASTIIISQTVTLTATVTGTPGVPVPTGTVTFFNGTAMLGTGTLNSSGVATYTTTAVTFPSMGTYTLTAVYGGDTNYAASASPGQTLTVKPGGLQLTPASLNFGNEPVGQTTAAQTVQVSNLGTTTVNISQIASEEGSNPGAFSVTSNCPAALAAGTSCTLSITFTPAGVGAESAGVAIVDDSIPAMQAVAVSGTGTGGILQVNPGSLKVIAGDGTIGYTGDGGAATAAELTQPNGIAFDPSGNLYIADINANVVRKVDTTGKITTFAGTGSQGYSGDGGPATSAELFLPFSVQSDTAGNIYIEDTGNNVIRKVNTSGTISTFAGNGTMGFAGDGGPAAAAEFNQPQGARFDKSGNLYVPQCEQSAVRKIDTTGKITTVAGNGTLGYSGDGGAATSAELACPSGVAFDAAGNFYIADDGNQVIRKVDTSGTITTIAGSTSGATGSSGDGGPAASALLNFPNDVVVDALGNLYIADSGNNRVRAINLATGVITTLAGGLNSAGSAAANTPLGLTLDAAGNVYFSDSGSGEIDEVFPQSTAPFPSTPVGSTAATQTVTLSNIGNVAITIPSADSFSTSGNAGDFALTGGTCLTGATLTGGSTCTVQISFTPTAIGARTLTVSVSDDALNSPQSFSIGGTATQGTPLVTWNMPEPITTTTPLSATQLDATAADSNGNTIPGTFVYSPAAGTTLPAGTQTLSVTFTPTDTTDYTTATGSTTVMVTGGSGGGPGGGSGTGTTTTTTLAVTSGGSAATTVASGGAVTLTATVTPSTDATVTPGQVAFCDATAASCTDIHRLATRQLISTEAGAQATYTFVPGIGSHSYQAVFLGTSAYAGSSSTASALAVTGLYPTTTTVAQSGTAGSFTLTGTVVGVVPSPVKTSASSVTIDLGQSAQTYVLTGTGASTIADATYGNYYNTQGSCMTSGTTTTCDLTGSFTGSTATYASGTYDFQTVFMGSVSSAVLSRTKYAVGTTEPNPFQYSGFAASTTMTLKLSVTGGGTYSIPIVASGSFATTLKGLDFAPVSPVCGGTSLGSDPCQQDYVGTVAGATYSGAVTGVVEFEVPAPTPAAAIVPTGTVSFLDTSNSNAVLGTGVLGTGTAGFTLAQASGSPVAVGKGPYGMDTGDLNGDGIVDLVVQNYNAGTVSVLLGNGDGTFQPQVTYTVGTLPERVLLADLNGDGKLDMVVANTGSQTIGVLLGNGDGTFQAQVTYPCGSPVGLALMDLNHDGIPDVVAGDYYNTQMSVLLGNGDGTLQAAVTYATGSYPQTVAEGDFNGDGNVDVVVGNFGGATVGVFLGNGDGTFQAQVTYAVGNQPQGVQVGDFNGDGNVDVAVSNSADGTIGVLLGKGDGTFQTQVTYPTGSGPVGIAIADFNGDGIDDITVNNTGSLTQGVLLGNGDGTFQAQVTFPTGNFPYGTTTGDFNGDGIPDIVAANYTDGTVTVYLSQPTETATAMATGISVSAGTHAAVVSYPGDKNFAKSVSTATNLVVSTTTPVITWAAPANIVYGTALSATQLDATATAAGVAVPGTFVYTPAAGTVLTAGTQTLSVTFTPTSTDFAAATATVPITVTQFAPVITWPAPAGIAYGTALSATQLDATVAGVGGTALAGTLVYSPAAGAVLTPGMQTLSVTFTPTDAVDYSAATGTVNLVVGGLSLGGIAPLGAVAGAGNTTITLTGTGFVPTSQVSAGETTLATTYVSPTMLTAVIPASLLAESGTYAVSVYDPSLETNSGAQTFTVLEPGPAANLTGPATTQPGSQPTVGLTIQNPYPLALTAEFTLTFAGATNPPVDDPAIQFSTGGRTYSYVVAANTTSVPPVELQAGTVAGTITIAAKLMADGVDVTPSTLAPLVIVVPAVVPVITGTTVTRSGDTLTVVIHGFSNTREVSQAVFDFTAATGDAVATPSLTLPATALFGAWFGSTESENNYGSAFTYTQTFDTSGAASTVGPVKVTLTNSVGTSEASTGP